MQLQPTAYFAAGPSLFVSKADARCCKHQEGWLRAGHNRLIKKEISKFCREEMSPSASVAFPDDFPGILFGIT
jgi:hypothetical protein